MAGRMLHEAYLLMGGNMGDRRDYLQRALNEINTHCGSIVKVSAIYETEAWGHREQEKFFNQAALVETGLSAAELLQAILKIEEQLGRKREIKYGPRIIDIDILLFDDEIIQKEGLTVPHPQLHNRRFALVPLAEINPYKIHPLLHKTVAELLVECPDKLNVNKIL